jgi:hypothetical protein
MSELQPEQQQLQPEQQQLQPTSEQQSKDTSTADNSLHTIIRNELMSTMTLFANQIELQFDYIDESVIQKVHECIKRCNDDEEYLKGFVRTVRSKLQDYSGNISSIVLTDRKISKHQYTFLNNLQLFEDALDFAIFAHENKNTKKTIVEFLHAINMSSMLLFGALNNELSPEELSKDLADFISNMKKEVDNKIHVQENALHRRKNTRAHSRKSPPIPDNPFGSLLSNSHILDIASDISKDLQSSKIDPMSLLTSLMSGKPNNQVNSIVESISKKIEGKIANGDLREDELKDQANKIMSSNSILESLGVKPRKH